MGAPHIIEDIMNIFKDGLLVDVSVSFWSGSKALSPADLGLKAEDVAEAFKLGKKMLVPQDVIRKFRAIESKARFIVEKNSFKFPIGNARFVPKKKFPAVLKKLKQCAFDYTQLTEQLVVNYEKYREEMLPVYKEAAEKAYFTNLPTQIEFNMDEQEKEKEQFINSFLMRISTFYPPASTLRDKFALIWDIYEIALPRMRKADGDKIVDDADRKEVATEEYRKQAHQKIGSFLDEVVKTLRQETVTVCTRIADRIKEGKVIKGRSLSSLNDFISNFSELNFVGDAVIEEELAKLKRDFLEDKHGDMEEGEIQQELGRRLGELADVASKITDVDSVTGGYRRKIEWED